MRSFLGFFTKVRSNYKNIFLILLPILLTVLVFRKYIFQGLLPIPADIIPGLYFPWFDYKWGYATPIPVQNAAVSDVISILYPWRILAFRFLKQGILPLWDPTILLGTPLLANFQSSVINPANIFFFITREYHAWSLGVVLQPLFTILTTYLFLRNIKLTRFPALFGSMLFAFSGYSIVWMEYNSIDYTIAYFPLILLSVVKISQKKDWKWFLILSLSICLQIVSGYPQNVIYTLIIAALYFVYCLIPEKRKTQKILYLFLAFILGLALSSIQLIPSAELYRISIRNLDKVALAGDVKYLPLKNLITIFFPDYFGNPGRWNYYGSGSFDNFAFSISSVGICFSLISLFFIKRATRHYRFFLALLIPVLIFVSKNPLSEWFSNIKILGFIAGSNTRVLFVVSIIFSIMAAYGIQIVLTKKIKLKQILFPVFLYTLFVLVHITIVFNNSGYNFHRIYGLVTNNMVSPDEQLKHLIVALRNMLIPTVMVYMVSISMILKNRYIVLWVGMFCLFASILNSTDKYLSFVKKELLYPVTEVTDFLKDNTKNSRFEKENNNLIFPSNSWTLYNLAAATGQNASNLLSTSRYLSLINYGEINDSIATRYNSIIRLNSPLIKTLNISNYAAINWLKDSPDITGKPNTWLLPQSFKEVANIKTVRIYKNTDNLGLAWFPKKIVCETKNDIIYEKIVSEYYSPEEMVFVNCDRAEIESSGKVEVKVDKYQANTLEFATNTDSDSFLIVSNAYYPGWKVYIDGGSNGILYKANTTLMAVFVPRGSHRVELKYNPSTVKWGLGISAISFLTWAIIFFVNIKQIKEK